MHGENLKGSASPGGQKNAHQKKTNPQTTTPHPQPKNPRKKTTQTKKHPHTKWGNAFKVGRGNEKKPPTSPHTGHRCQRGSKRDVEGPPIERKHKHGGLEKKGEIPAVNPTMLSTVEKQAEKGDGKGRGCVRKSNPRNRRFTRVEKAQP